MADPPSSSSARRVQHEHLDATGSRQVVYCHGCDNEWYNDEHGLTCPSCDGEATEIISPENDPRAISEPPEPTEALRSLQDHSPWPADAPDPDDGDIEDFVTDGPGGHHHFFTHTFTTHGPGASSRPNQQPFDDNDPAHVMRDFHQLLGHFLGPNLREGQAGRSGPEDLFSRDEPDVLPFGRRTQHGPTGGNMGGTRIYRQQFTFTPGQPLQRRDAGDQTPAEDFATYASPVPHRPFDRPPSYLVIAIRAPPDQLRSILGSLFGAMAPEQPNGTNAQRGPGPPPGIQGLLASLFNPANAQIGDAVYSQEALDRIISTLMEQHPTSNAPGPASADAIANLPKKKIDEKMLGAEGKADCSVCMDDVYLGNEVVVLPCTHWFHETCATAWLSEHNTCPICRTGIGGETNSPTQNANNASLSSSPNTRATDNPNPEVRRASFSRRMSRNEARLESIRDRGRLPSTPETSDTPRRYQVIGDGPIRQNRTRSPSPPSMPGSFASNNPFRRRDSASEMSEGQRESRRAVTSGSDESRRSSQSGGSGGSNGPMSWLRRFTPGGGRRRQD